MSVAISFMMVLGHQTCNILPCLICFTVELFLGVTDCFGNWKIFHECIQSISYRMCVKCQFNSKVRLDMGRSVPYCPTRNFVFQQIHVPLKCRSALCGVYCPDKRGLKFSTFSPYFTLLIWCEIGINTG